jgi:hypothetical protein
MCARAVKPLWCSYASAEKALFDDALHVIEQWRRHYNAIRPHSSLAYLTPDDPRKRCGLRDRCDDIVGCAEHEQHAIAGAAVTHQRHRPGILGV